LVIGETHHAAAYVPAGLWCGCFVALSSLTDRKRYFSRQDKKNGMTRKNRKPGKDGAGYSAMLDMAQSAKKNVTPRSGVTRKKGLME
jgi:hypothetical protein